MSADLHFVTVSHNGSDSHPFSFVFATEASRIRRVDLTKAQALYVIKEMAAMLHTEEIEKRE